MSELVQPIRIAGLRDMQKALKDLDGESQKELRLALNEAANVVVNVARRRVPVVTGAARASIRASSGQRSASVSAGGRKAPYFPWLDYGGTVGRGRSGKAGTVGAKEGNVKRPFIKSGRYIYPAYSAQHDNVMRLLDKRIRSLVESKGLHVT